MVELHRQAANIQGNLLEMVAPEFLRSLPEDEITSPMTALYNTRSDPDNGSEHKELMKKYISVCGILLDLLSEDKEHLLIEIEQVLLDMCSIEKELAFRQGLRNGFRLAMEILAKPVNKPAEPPHG